MAEVSKAETSKREHGDVTEADAVADKLRKVREARQAKRAPKAEAKKRRTWCQRASLEKSINRTRKLYGYIMKSTIIGCGVAFIAIGCTSGSIEEANIGTETEAVSSLCAGTAPAWEYCQTVRVTHPFVTTSYVWTPCGGSGQIECNGTGIDVGCQPGFTPSTGTYGAGGATCVAHSLLNNVAELPQCSPECSGAWTDCRNAGLLTTKGVVTVAACTSCGNAIGVPACDISGPNPGCNAAAGLTNVNGTCACGTGFVALNGVCSACGADSEPACKTGTACTDPHTVMLGTLATGASCKCAEGYYDPGTTTPQACVQCGCYEQPACPSGVYAGCGKKSAATYQVSPLQQSCHHSQTSMGSQTLAGSVSLMRSITPRSSDRLYPHGYQNPKRGSRPR